jgi:transmembrane sensor
MDESRFEFIATLLRKQLKGELNRAEKTTWEQWLAESPENRDLADRLQDPELLMQDLKLYYEAKQNILGKIREHIPELQSAEEEIRKSPLLRISFAGNRFLKYAAAIVLLLSMGGLFWHYHKPIENTTARFPSEQKMIQPGTDKAILTLGNGSKILLDSTHQGNIANENGTAVSVRDNLVSYRQEDKAGPVSYNTMTTPRGGQYKLLLPDGSAVWLNAQSSITYPVRFTEKERKVSITGEVYFEVAKDPAHPFVVDIQSKTFIEVLGTHFNVNAYEDEPSQQTTLIEGSVLIRNGKNRQMLKPNQQAKIDASFRMQVVSLKANELNEVMAWKDGTFYFLDADIHTLMRQLARWYDFDLSYAGEVKEKFHLEMQRNTSVENVFKILEATRGVHFKIEGRKITVIP